jgi:acetyltransferase
MDRSDDHAKAAGLDGIEGIVLATNKPMLSLALSLGFTAAADPGDATIARLRRELDD